MKLHSLKVDAVNVPVTEHEAALLVSALAGEPVDASWTPVVNTLITRLTLAQSALQKARMEASHGTDDAEGA